MGTLVALGIIESMFLAVLEEMKFPNTGARR